ncbi:hypothetical protein JHW43_008474 [Diplocarpon mali]|nr:hypothetical protein JHW43_008474 [Diplocarpon mali]
MSSRWERCFLDRRDRASSGGWPLPLGKFRADEKRRMGRDRREARRGEERRRVRKEGCMQPVEGPSGAGGCNHACHLTPLLIHSARPRPRDSRTRRAPTDMPTGSDCADLGATGATGATEHPVSYAGLTRHVNPRELHREGPGPAGEEDVEDVEKIVVPVLHMDWGPTKNPTLSPGVSKDPDLQLGGGIKSSINPPHPWPPGLRAGRWLAFPSFGVGVSISIRNMFLTRPSLPGCTIHSPDEGSLLLFPPSDCTSSGFASRLARNGLRAAQRSAAQTKAMQCNAVELGNRAYSPGLEEIGHGTRSGDRTGTVRWDLGTGIWDLGTGIWELGSGIWELASGIWDLGSGVGRLGAVQRSSRLGQTTKQDVHEDPWLDLRLERKSPPRTASAASPQIDERVLIDFVRLSPLHSGSAVFHQSIPLQSVAGAAL